MKRFVVTALAVSAGCLAAFAPAAAAAPATSPGQYCQTSGIIGSFFDPNAFFANQGGCASSIAQGATILSTPFGPDATVISRAGYISRCKQFVSELGLTYPFTTPDGEFTNIQNLNQCADRLQQLHDSFATG